MQNSFDHIIRDLKENKYSPVYFLQGPEPFFIDQITEFIEENALEESQRAFNQMIVYGKDAKVADIIAQAKRFPAMAERQVVIVKEAQEVDDLQKEKGIKILLNYLSNPVPSTILVFAYKYKKLDGRKELSKAFNKAGVLFESKKIYDNELEKWIDIILKSKGLKADSKAVFLIAENIGLDLSRINNELEKIRLSTSADEVIDDKKVLKHIGISREYNLWEFQKAIASKNKKKAFAIIDYFDKNPKAAPLVLILQALYSLFSRLLIIHQLKLNNPNVLKEEMGLNYYAAQDYLIAARTYPFNRIPHIISSLRLADAQLKGVEASQMKESVILKELALRIMF